LGGAGIDADAGNDLLVFGLGNVTLVRSVGWRLSLSARRITWARGRLVGAMDFRGQISEKPLFAKANHWVVPGKPTSMPFADASV
ncbi:MAG: hypothetical protein M3Y72_10565, partial [Acidobacteriota bacterium]|nr:hypothetical protein [Acidobacteriota bacterium]